MDLIKKSEEDRAINIQKFVSEGVPLEEAKLLNERLIHDLNTAANIFHLEYWKETLSERFPKSDWDITSN